MRPFGGGGLNVAFRSFWPILPQSHLWALMTHFVGKCYQNFSEASKIFRGDRKIFRGEQNSARRTPKWARGGKCAEESVPRPLFLFQTDEKSTDNEFPWAGPRSGPAPNENHLSVDSFQRFGTHKKRVSRHRFRGTFPSEGPFWGPPSTILLAEEEFCGRRGKFCAAEDKFW